MPEEQLLQGGWLARQAPHPERGDVSQHVVELMGVDVELHAAVVDDGVVHTRELREVSCRLDRLGTNRGPREMPKVIERAGFDGAAAPDDAHAVAQRLDLGEDM